MPHVQRGCPLTSVHTDLSLVRCSSVSASSSTPNSHGEGLREINGPCLPGTLVLTDETPSSQRVNQLLHFKNCKCNPSPGSPKCSGIENSGNLNYAPFLSSPMLRTGRCKRLEKKNVGAVRDIGAYDISPFHPAPPRPCSEHREKQGFQPH